MRRRRWADPDAVVAQVCDRLSSKPDVIALAGSGEPTLHAGIGEVIDGIKAVTDVPVAVITNGSLLGRPAVRRGLAAADIVLPSLDAPDEGLFRKVNRPHGTLRLADVVDGMVAFRAGYRERSGLRSCSSPVSRDLRRGAAARGARGAHRPRSDPAEHGSPSACGVLRSGGRRSHTRAASPTLFTPRAEVIADLPASAGEGVAVAADVLELLSRRPCTVADIASGLAMHHGEALKAATALVNEGAADVYTHEGRSFYVATTIAAPRDRRREA